MDNLGRHTNTDKSQLNASKKAFDYKGEVFSSLKRMCNTYNTYPEHYLKQIQSGKGKKQALTGKLAKMGIVKILSIILLSLICTFLIYVSFNYVDVPLNDSFVSGLASPGELSTTEKVQSQANLGVDKLHVDYSNLVTLNTNNNTATCSIENTSSADIRFSVECVLNTQSGSQITLAKNNTIIKPKEKIDSLSLETGVKLPTEKVSATFLLTLYEGDSTTPLTQKVQIHSIIVSPG